MIAANNPQGPSQAPALQLEDIHLPEQITSLPIAFGWWLLLSVVIIAMVFFIKRHQQNKRRCYDKVQAIKKIQENPELSVEQTISVLKWAAMRYFDRSLVANLYGTGFQRFLSEQLPLNQQGQFIDLSKAAFEGQYQRSLDKVSIEQGITQSTSNQLNNQTTNAQCREAALIWLTNALPVLPQKAIADKNIGVATHD